MLTALTDDGRRIKAERSGARGCCPGCGNDVVARCGTVLRWHWAHLGTRFCDWYTGETDWHLDWKAEAPADRQERVLENHRADIVTPAGIVIELQHSHLSGDIIRDRELAYRRMVWLFDARDAYAAGRLRIARHPDREATEDLHRNIRWDHAPSYTDQVEAPLFLDIGNDTVLWVGNWFQYGPLRGHGWAVTRDWFATTVINGTYYPRPPHRGITLTAERLKRHAQRPAGVFGGICLAWSDHRVGNPLPCRICGQPAHMRDAEVRPCHKTCVEDLAWLDGEAER